MQSVWWNSVLVFLDCLITGSLSACCPQFYAAPAPSETWCPVSITSHVCSTGHWVRKSISIHCTTVGNFLCLLCTATINKHPTTAHQTQPKSQTRKHSNQTPQFSNHLQLTHLITASISSKLNSTLAGNFISSSQKISPLRGSLVSRGWQWILASHLCVTPKTKTC
jgi:hypothetical protein